MTFGETTQIRLEKV